ncbi:hypothetical protein BOX15_Mlig022652g2, partial [Macrostomum lignano]
KPTVTMPSIDYNSCAIDSPDFRYALLDQERQLEESVKTMKSVIDSFKRVQETGRAYNEALVAFSLSIQKLGPEQQQQQFQTDSSSAQAQSANLSKAERDMAKFASQFAKDLRYIEDARMRWLDISQESFLKVLTQQRMKIREFLSETRRVYYEETKKFYHSQERMLSLKQQTGKNSEPRNWSAIDKDAEAERICYFNRTYAYVKTLQCEQAKNKVRFFEVLATLQSVWKCFYQECNDNLVEREKNMQATNESVANYNEGIGVAEKELDENRQKLLDMGAWRRRGNHQETLEGYLLLLSQKKLSVAPNNWQRCFCTFNRQKRLLTLQPFSPANPGRTDSSSSPSDSGLGGVVVAVGVPPNSEVDRRFLFEVEINDSTRTLLLQAYSNSEFKCWTQSLRGEPASAEEASEADESRQRPTEFEAQQFEACLAELDRRCLDEEGLYRVEGRSKLVEEFVRGFIMGRPDGMAPVQSLDQVDVRVLSSSVKRYLKQLPEPLMTYAVVERLLQLLSATGAEASALVESPDTIDQLRSEMDSSLPQQNRRLLQSLMSHFGRLTDRSEVNKMTPANVAIVFAPTLCWPQQVNLQSMQACAITGRYLVLALMQHPDRFLCASPIDASNRSSFSASSTAAAPPLASPMEARKGSKKGSGQGTNLLGYSIGNNNSSGLVSQLGMNLEGPKRCARTLYACTGDSPAELSFEANELVYDVQRIARVDGWCFGMINGRSGIIPSNYIQILQ